METDLWRPYRTTTPPVLDGASPERGAVWKVFAVFGRCVLVVAAVAALSSSAVAQGPAVVVIRDDPGGEIPARIHQMAELRAEGVKVELRGSLCASACTLLLGLDDVCVDRQTRFAFHGPSHYGTPLPPESFEYWSSFMARQYREPIRTWFMTTARFTITGYSTLTGADLIRYGYPACD